MKSKVVIPLMVIIAWLLIGLVLGAVVAFKVMNFDKQGDKARCDIQINDTSNNAYAFGLISAQAQMKNELINAYRANQTIYIPYPEINTTISWRPIK